MQLFIYEACYPLEGSDGLWTFAIAGSECIFENVLLTRRFSYIKVVRVQFLRLQQTTVKGVTENNGFTVD